MNGRTIPSRTVFLSSTTSDLASYRKVAHEVIDEINAEFIGRFSLTGSSMLSEPQSGERQTAVKVSRDWVAAADWLVLIVAWNYGFVPPGAKCSVTEWEYREAVENSKPPKKCFVFLAGGDEPGDGELAYFPIKGKEDNLMKWKGCSGHEEELAAFKSRLRGGPHRLFSDIDHFRKLLASTLKRRIERELAARSDGPNLNRILLLTGLLTPVRQCISTVRTLSTVKELHDRLHRIRQFGISNWREVVLTRWQTEGEASGESKVIFLEGLSEVKDLIGEMRALYASLTQDQQAGMPQIPRVLEHFKDGGGYKLDSRRGFQASIDRFASRVEVAFSACDWQMRQVANLLRSQHQHLSSKARVALGSDRLTADERDLLRDELAQTMALHERLQSVLEQHNEWQRVHDALEVVDQSLAREEFEMAIAPVIDARQETAALVAKGQGLVEDPGRRKSCEELIATVQSTLSLLSKGGNAKAYRAMRKAFDDLFFLVDVEVLTAVRVSGQRAARLESQLLAKEEELEREGAKSPGALNSGN